MGKPIIGVLMGDPSGVGPELLAKLAGSGKLTAECRPVMLGDVRVFADALKQFHEQAKYEIIEDITPDLFPARRQPALSLHRNRSAFQYAAPP